MEFKTFGVVGGGAWGTALAQTLRLSGQATILWAKEPETVANINTEHVNKVFLPGVPLDPGLRATAELRDVAENDAILMVAPAQHMRAVAQGLSPNVAAGVPLIICAKGIEQTTGHLMAQVLTEVIPHARLAVLSGPSFAADVARGLPAAVTLACKDEALGRSLGDKIGYRRFRVYWTNDMTGVELGGALKNVLAIAAGIVDGKGLGPSAHAALVTRGFAELRRFAEARGARPETLSGLSGLGDLILTCGSPKSRNMSLGRALGQGRSLDEALGDRVAVTEGVYTARAVKQIADASNIEMPITQAVASVLDGRITVDDAIAGLMLRPQKAED